MLEMWEENPNYHQVNRRFLLRLPWLKKLFRFIQEVLSKPLPTRQSCLILALFFIISPKYGSSDSPGFIILLFIYFLTWYRESRYIGPKFPLSFPRLSAKSSRFLPYVRLTSCVFNVYISSFSKPVYMKVLNLLQHENGVTENVMLNSRML